MRTQINDGWTLCERPLDWTADDYGRVDMDSGKRWTVNLPCDVREPLIADGSIAEPLEGLNCFDSEWVEDRSWWFRRELELTADQLGAQSLQLVFESIDLEADLFVNGHHAAHHRSAHYPCTVDLKTAGRIGANDIVLRVTTGAEKINRELSFDMGRSVTKTYRRGDDRRTHLRKPQYVFGWDWGPRVVTCGIVKDVFLEACEPLECRDAAVVTRRVADDGRQAALSAALEVVNHNPEATVDAEVRLILERDGAEVLQVSRSGLLRSGVNYLDFDLTLEDPELWWPRGMGAQPLYGLRVELVGLGRRFVSREWTFGVRTLELNQDKVDSGHLFRLMVNGRDVFCRGANWIPADSLYARVTDEKYEALIREAAEANFTMLRIWGGGIYEKDLFYELCDREGLLVWQDFMFACALYPDQEAWFREESAREIDYQTRRLNIRYKDSETGKNTIAHSLNNTVAASPRILIPIVEMNQNADGSITIPQLLRPYMGGADRIG